MTVIPFPRKVMDNTPEMEALLYKLELALRQCEAEITHNQEVFYHLTRSYVHLEIERDNLLTLLNKTTNI